MSNEAKESSSNSEKWHKLLNEGTEYISIAEPRVFPTVCNLNCPVSVDYLQQQLTALTIK